MDVDSTLIAGRGDRAAGRRGGLPGRGRRDHRARDGRRARLRGRRCGSGCALLAGLDDEPRSTACAARIRLTPGRPDLRATLQRLGFRVAIVSRRVHRLHRPAQGRAGLDHAYANKLEIVDGRLTGEVVGPMVDRAARPSCWPDRAAKKGSRSPDGGGGGRCERPRHARRAPVWASPSTPSRSSGTRPHGAVGALARRDLVHARRPPERGGGGRRRGRRWSTRWAT